MPHQDHTIKHAPLKLRNVRGKGSFKRAYASLYDAVNNRIMQRCGKRLHSGAKAHTVNTDLSCYHAIVNETMPELWQTFYSNEISALTQIWEGHQVDFTTLFMWVRSGLLALVTRERRGEACKRFEVNGDALVSKVAGLTDIQTIALLDFLTVFWRCYEDHKKAKNMVNRFTGPDGE